MLKPQLAASGGVAGSMRRNELQIGDRLELQSGAKQVKMMEREISHEALEQMSLESLLYHVLVGDGRPVKKPA